jgi:two-component system chemotaxis response regulator CheB
MMGHKLVVIGASWGGLRALNVILPALPGHFPAAVAIAQHRRPDSPRDAMASMLQAGCRLPTKEVDDKETIEPGRVYLAPSDYHLLVEEGYFSLSTDELVQYARPSVDVLFESAADSYGEKVVAVILTGLNEDGSDGITRIKEAGGHVIVQHPDSAEKPTMPLAAIDKGVADSVLALGDIGPAVVELVTGTADRRVRS